MRRTLFCRMAFSIRSSVIESCFSSSLMNRTLVISAPHFANLGLMVSAMPSSAVWYNTLKGSMGSALGSSFPLVQYAAIAIASHVFPFPGFPWIKVTFPKGINGYHNHWTTVSSTSDIFMTGTGFSLASLQHICFAIFSTGTSATRHSFQSFFTGSNRYTLSSSGIRETNCLHLSFPGSSLSRHK